MNRLPLFAAILAVLLSVAAIYFSKSSSELVYVDVNKLIDGYKRTKIAKVDLEKKSSAAKTNVDSLMTNWEKELSNYEAERAGLSPKELKLKQELLSTKQHQINAFRQSVEKQIKEEDSKVTQTLLNDINDYIKEYGKSHNYKIIFGASGTGNIMYADESTDLTAEVLKGLNEEYDKK